MRIKLIAAIASALLLSACASATRSEVPSQILPPEFRIAQIGGVSSAGRNITGPLPIQFQIEVRNPSGSPITLNRIQLETLGEGAYSIRPSSKPFDSRIEAGQSTVVEMWTPAVSSDTILGVNGPVTLRMIATFKSEFGAFQRVIVTQVNDQLGGSRVVR